MGVSAEESHVKWKGESLDGWSPDGGAMKEHERAAAAVDGPDYPIERASRQSAHLPPRQRTLPVDCQSPSRVPPTLVLVSPAGLDWCLHAI